VKSPAVRCAIYTRKSTEEGLDQAFNTLQAQREACEAYILSQAGEGWMVLPERYDDGGFSGGTMDRPALGRLLKDVDAGRIDTIVVYKIDRLTRSLADFARIVERLDKSDASFVSVTQAFNTTTSMGRLTLNVLLSFAQFEREVTGERIRDKIAASKKKGMWMGGNLPLGYDAPTDPTTRNLVPNTEEAEQVRSIFRLYLELGSVSLLEQRLDADEIRSKRWISRKGTIRGGTPLGRGALFHLLRNKVYLGHIPHGGVSYPDCHPPIVDAPLFEAVQRKLDDNLSNRRERPLRSDTLRLKGRVFDAAGDPMSPSFGYGRGGKLYRYYVSAPLQQGRSASTGAALRRVKAETLDEAVRGSVAGCLDRPGADLSELLPRIARVEVTHEALHISLDHAGLTSEARRRLARTAQSGILTVPIRCKSRGGRVWAPATEAGRRGRKDPALIKSLRKAHRIASGVGWRTRGATDIAEAPSNAYDRKLCRLAFLAPDIQRAILEGRQPPDLTLDQLLHQPISPCWRTQRIKLGFAPIP